MMVNKLPAKAGTMAAQDYNKQYYEANKEKEKERSLKYYHENKDKIDREAKKAYMAEYLKTYKRRKLTPQEREERARKRRERYAADAEYRERAKRQARENNKRNPHTKRNGRLKADFNITLEEYNALLEKQDGACAICGTKATGVQEPGKREHSMYVDHNHATGAVRGLLCSRCNFGLGHFRDNPQLLLKAAEYLTNGLSGVTSTTNND